MKLAEVLLTGVGDLLLEIPEADHASGVTDDDIGHFTAAITRLLQYADSLFSIARKGARVITQDD
jgi:hypothetical protein